MAIIPGGAKVMQLFRQPGQSLSDIKAEWDELTEQDQRDLIGYAIDEGLIEVKQP